MSPWTVFAQAFVYPVARAWADAFFDAQRQASLYQEESPNETDADRAARFRSAVGRLPGGAVDTGPEYPTQDLPANNSDDISTTLRRKAGGD